MPVEIPLTRGYVAIVDEDDAPLVLPYKWQASISRNTVYAVRTIREEGRRIGIKMHRFILDITDPAFVVDHIDCNGLNNTRVNLRKCSPNSNLFNRTTQKNNKSGVIGVQWCNTKKRWQATISYAPNKRKSLGYFRSFEDAKEARRKGELQYYGEFARQSG